ncbi:Chromatin assembly factor 1 subunit, partial [Spiromyces aspiralis]
TRKEERGIDTRAPLPLNNDGQSGSINGNHFDDGPLTMQQAPRTTHMFYSDNLTTFFRRLCFTCDGSMLIAPAGIYKGSVSDQATTQEATNTAYLWARRRIGDGPAAHLPGHERPVVVAKCCPVKLEPHRSDGALEGEGPNDSESCWAELPQHRLVFALASQSAVVIYDTMLGARDSTAGPRGESRAHEYRAIGFMDGLHYASITDLAWYVVPSAAGQ